DLGIANDALEPLRKVLRAGGRDSGFLAAFHIVCVMALRDQSFRRSPRKGFRRQFGLDRSGPPPRQTRPGQPLRPWTIPNLVGYIRLAALPIFLVLAFNSGDGRDPAAAAIFWAVAVGDYVDGFLARATGQYSRLGALLDPIVDRLTILCGAAVCWHFELL